MIDMFTNYQNLSDSYIPNNMNSCSCKPQSYTKLDPCEATKPYELYNAKNELEGYFWNYGDSINLEFEIDGEIILGENSYIDVKDYLKTATATIRLYNFKYEVIRTEIIPADNTILSIYSEYSNIEDKLAP